MDLDTIWLHATLQAFGFSFVERVDELGDAVVRDQVTDVFLADGSGAIRLEAEDGRLSSIRSFNPVDQRSIEERDAISLLPVTEAFTIPGEPVAGLESKLLPQGAVQTLFDYLPEAVLSVMPGLDDVLADRSELIRDEYEA